MTLDTRIAAAVHHVADGVVVPDVDLDAVRAGARTNRRHTAVLLTVAVVVAVVVAGATTITGRDATPPVSPAGSVSPTVTPLPPLDTGSWTTYRSSRYDLTIGHPPGWTVLPSSRRWTRERDVRHHLSPAHEAFLDADGQVRVSAWNAPLDASTRVESMHDLVAWAESYCRASGNSPCEGIADRGVELCLEARDCHPGLLVRFDEDVQAFFSGGIYSHDAMTVVAVWRPESSRYVAAYGGAERLLEAFLSTMEVWPRPTPFPGRR